MRLLPFLLTLPVLSASALHSGNAGPKEFEIKFKLPPPPVLTPEQALRTLRLAEPGLEVQIVAAEPLIAAPVAISFDPLGRLYVCEMRGYMRDVEGTTEHEPTGRISRLTDTDGDGRMDQASIFVDQLVMPRAVLAVGEDGALVAEPPNLIHFRDTDGDGVADSRTVVATDFGRKGGQPEHMANSPTPFPDNWIYCSNHNFRYRYAGGEWRREAATGRGQWGLTHDDLGRPYFNYNSDLLRSDRVPALYQARHPSPAFKSLWNAKMMASGEVWPGHPTPGMNRGYGGGMREDGSLKSVTGTCGPGVYRGGLLPAGFDQNVFIPEPVGNLVKRVVLTERDGLAQGANAYTGKEFLTSPDERFRPVNCATGPDGALHIVDLARGIVQHTAYLTHYLVANIKDRKLEQPWDQGRIWRVVPKGTSPRAVTVPRDVAGRVGALASPNGWVRDTAQRLMVEQGQQEAVPALAALILDTQSPALARWHALWTLEGLGALRPETLNPALADPDPRVRALALRLSEPWLLRLEKALVLPAVLRAVEKPSGPVRLQGLLTLGGLVDPMAEAAALDLLLAGPLSVELAEAYALGQRGRELAALQRVLADARLREVGGPVARLLAAVILAEGRGEKTLAALQLLPGAPGKLRAELLNGLVDASGARKGRPVHLPTDGSGLGAWAAGDKKTRDAWKKVDAVLAWPGKPGAPPPPVVKPLSTEEEALFARGKPIYETLCGACHQLDGRGLSGLAPPLADTEWTLGPDGRLIRIVLQGLTGPIRVAGMTYEMDMPPLGQLDDHDVAAVLTYIRRAWDHGAAPVTPARVKAVRAETASRALPWTEAELLKIK
jgi:mono/diheme cytochrome c family protein/glucose/arabinose dehydrogenase